MASLSRLEKKLHKRKHSRDRQIRKYKKTRDEGHAKAAHHHAAAVKYLRQLITKKRSQMTLGDKAIEVADGLIGVMEQGGNNSGPMVGKIIQANGGYIGEPWCGDFVAYCYSLAGSKLVQRAWASVSMLGSLGGLTRTSNPQRGDLVRYEFDHVGLFEKDNGDGTITTIEGNTGASGAVSDSTTGGDGVYRKIRDKSLVNDYLHVTA